MTSSFGEQGVGVQWLTAFLDLPAEQFTNGVAFWQRITNSQLSPLRGDNDEFATLLPPDGDSYVRVQQVADGPGGIHLDLHVEDVDAAVNQAVSLSATVLFHDGYATLRSPAGFVFCLVPPQEPTTGPGLQIPSAVRSPGGGFSRLDQVSVDVPAARWYEETTFWYALTGWELKQSELPEYRSLVMPEGIPLRLIFQRLGDDDPRAVAHAHLDLGAGDARAMLAGEHQLLGATLVDTHQYWVTLKDPAGQLYCLTHRQVN